MKKILLILFVSIFLLNSIFALDSLGTFQQDNNVRISQVCNDASFITITSITYPNSSLAVNFTNMSVSSPGEFYYDFNDTGTIGRYDVKGTSDGCENTFATYFEINKIGYESTEARTDAIDRGIYFTAILGILFFVMFAFKKEKLMVKWTYFGMSMLFFLITLNILFVALETETVNPALESFFDSFTAIFWYMFWFIAGFLIIGWIFTMFQTYIYRKNMNAVNRFGGS